MKSSKNRQIKHNFKDWPQYAKPLAVQSVSTSQWNCFDKIDQNRQASKQKQTNLVPKESIIRHSK